MSVPPLPDEIPEEAPEAAGQEAAGPAARRAARLLPQPRMGGLIPWVIAILIALVVIAAAGGLSLRNLAETARADLASAVTVQVIEPNPDLRAARGATVIAALVAALVAASGESLRDLVLDAGAIAAVLAVPIIMGLAGRGQGTHAALAAIITEIAVLGVLDWGLGVEGAFLWMIASGVAVFAAVAALGLAGAGVQPPCPCRAGRGSGFAVTLAGWISSVRRFHYQRVPVRVPGRGPLQGWRRARTT